MPAPHTGLRSTILLALLSTPAAAQAVYLGAGQGLAAPGDLFGYAVAQTGDYDGDGIAEILVGAPGYDDPGWGPDAGNFWVLSGATGAVLDRFNAGFLSGEEVGRSLATLGDMNGDGVEDFAVGRAGRSYLGMHEIGAVSVYGGNLPVDLLWTVNGPKAGARLGEVLAGVGDIDGDGAADVLAGAPGWDGPGAASDDDWGWAALYSGDDKTELAVFPGDGDGDRLGAALAGLPDLNGDGTPEFAIGIPFNDTGSPFPTFDSGSVRVYSGATRTLMFTLNGSSAGEELGASITALGDTNLDGVPEFAVGRPGWSNGRGRVTVHSGPTGKIIATLNGPQLTPQDRYGSVVCGAGDMDKNGRPDLLVTAPAEGTGFGGWAHVMSGGSWTQYGDAFNGYADQGFGTAVAAGRDTTGDGWVDAVFGLPGNDGEGTDAGLMWAYRFTHYQPDILFAGPGPARLEMYGTELYTGGQADLVVRYAPALAPVYLLASATSQPVAFKGGVIVPQVASGLLVTLVSDATGQVKLTGIPGGGGLLQVYLQALMPAAGAPQGWWITNALAVQLLP